MVFPFDWSANSIFWMVVNRYWSLCRVQYHLPSQCLPVGSLVHTLGTSDVWLHTHYLREEAHAIV